MNITMEEAVKQSDLEETQTKDKQELKWNINDFLKPERLETETYEQYKERQKISKMFIKQRLKGKMWWMAKDSANVVKGVTYNKEKYKEALIQYNKYMEEKKQKDNELKNTTNE